MKRIEILASAVVLILTAALYAAGALRADPGIDAARSDLEVLRVWKERGSIEDLKNDPSHLPKPGHLILLRAMLPHAARDPGEVRRFLIFNAVAVLAGLAAAGIALARRCGSRAALIFLIFAFFYFPARDSSDYIASEPLAIGVSLFFFAGLLGAGEIGPRRALLAGLACAPILLMRPNLGWVLFAVSFVSLASARRLFASGLALLAGFLAGSALLFAAERVTGLPTNPLGVNTSKAFLWGTADYYWPPDVGGWPVGKTARESALLQMEKSKARWKDLLGRRGADAARSLLWRTTHSLLSCEELPSRWNDRGYFSFDKLLRNWWWLGAALLSGATVALAVGGRGRFRLVPLFLLLSCVAQGLVFGADPRLALPFIPLVALSLATALSEARLRAGAAAAGGIAATLLVLAVVAVPDAANSDFVALRGPGHRLEQEISAGQFPASESATLHLRLLKPATFALGLAITGNGLPLYRREAQDTSPTPAYLSLVLRGPALERARKSGLKLEVMTLDDSSRQNGFYYFPAVPRVFGRGCRIDGAEDLPSGYGGNVRGSLPVWVHAGAD